MLPDFNTFWKTINKPTGPEKFGKKAALRHFNASVKNERDFTDLLAALENYRRDLKEKPWKHPMHGSTFLMNWRDWILEEAEEVPLQEPLQAFTYRCVWCPTPHDWVPNATSFPKPGETMACKAAYERIMKGRTV